MREKRAVKTVVFRAELVVVVVEAIYLKFEQCASDASYRPPQGCSENVRLPL